MIQALQMFRKNPDIVFNYNNDEQSQEEETSVEVNERVSVIADGSATATEDISYSHTSEVPVVTGGNELEDLLV